MPALLSPSTSLRDSDLVNTQNTCLAWTEKIIAEARIQAENVLKTAFGYRINQGKSPKRWHPDPQKTERCHLLDKTEIDPTLGIHALSSQTLSPEVLAGHYVDIGPWYHIPADAENLRSVCLGPILVQKYFGLEKHLERTVSALNLSECPVNHRPPGYSMTRHGPLLRFDPATASAFARYFLVDEISAQNEPASVQLGAGCSLVWARSDDPLEPVRAVITNNNWSLRMGTKELARWLRGIGNQKEACTK